MTEIKMSILLITGMIETFDSYGRLTGKKEFMTSHGIDLDTDKVIITSNEHPRAL